MKKILAAILILLIISGKAYSQTSVKLSPQEFQQKIESGNVQLVDVRTAEEYTEGHIPHAMLANWKDMKAFRKTARKLDKKLPVLVYCKSGNRSKAASEWLLKKGFKEVYELEGGFKNYQEQKEQE